MIRLIKSLLQARAEAKFLKETSIDPVDSILLSGNGIPYFLKEQAH